MRTFLNYCKLFALLIASFFAFAVLSCLIPDKSIKENIEKSALMLAEEGNYPHAVIGMAQCQMDNFTDALILSQNYCIDRKHPFQSAMKMIRPDELGTGWDQTGLLLRKTQGEAQGEISYARYWHGNTFLFRPFFLLMDYNMLRWWLFALSTLLLVVFLCAFYRETGMLQTLAFASGFVAVCGFVTQFSIQFFPILAITLIASLLVIKRGALKPQGMLFFIVGSLACYFDLLTAPMLTLGIPLAVLLSLKRNEDFRIKDNLLEIIKLALLWGLGFALTFVAKWVLGTLILGHNVFADAFDMGLYRLGVEDFTRWDAISRNFKMLNLPMILVLMLCFISLLVTRHAKCNWKKSVLFLLLGLTPYVWYFVFSNHSYLHWWFTYRLQAIAVVSLLLMLTGTKEKTPDSN
ncbi:MAG: hypothetical protein IKR29_00095 [Bacteroidales bacterium]|nr:hypothetical protein [Bacteroidales bacterium]